MKLFLDANVLVTVLNREYPLFDTAARVLSLGERKGVELCTSTICLAIAFYFAEKKSGAAKAKEKMALLTNHLSIADLNAKTVRETLEDSAVLDFEDGLEYYVATYADCTHFVTEDLGDFHFAKIPVMSCRDVLFEAAKVLG